MPRQPKLRKKQVGQTTYWYTEAGGATYFGNVDAVPFAEARNLFNDHIKSLSDGVKDSKAKRLATSSSVRRSSSVSFLGGTRVRSTAANGR